MLKAELTAQLGVNELAILEHHRSAVEKYALPPVMVVLERQL